METLDKHFRTLSKASFARYGFAYGDLMAQWPEIVGAGLADYCEPERIRWPKSAGEGDARQGGGVLVIRAAAGRGLDLQHEGPHIIERINRFFGYGAITQLKIMQGRMVAKPMVAKPAPDAKLEQDLATRLNSIADDKLREALARLGRGALAGKRSSPQGK